MRQSWIWIIAAVVVIVAIVAVLALNHGTGSVTPTPSPAASSAPVTETPSTTPSSPAASTTVHYTSNGFSPASVTVKSGESITFVNDTNSTIQVDSNPHPVHTDDPDLNVGAIAPGQSKSATLNKTGTFGIHNHLSPSVMGSVTIQ